MRMFAAFAAGDLDALVATVHPNSRWVYYGAREHVLATEVVDEAVTARLEDGEGRDVRLILRGVGPTRRERDGDVVAGVLRRALDRRAAPENDQVRERDLLSARLSERPS